MNRAFSVDNHHQYTGVNSLSPNTKRLSNRIWSTIGPLFGLIALLCISGTYVFIRANRYIDGRVNELKVEQQRYLLNYVDQNNDHLRTEMWQTYQQQILKNQANQMQAQAAGSLSLINANFPKVKKLNAIYQKRILVTGGAGFVGSHLVDKLMIQGHKVTVVDNFFTGRRENVEQWIGHPNFALLVHDVIEPLLLEVDQIYHLACPASPPHYQYNPIKTIKTSSLGTMNMLGLASRVKGRLLLASTSEVYGDPEVHPQKETYWGHVNTMGPRSCYDEGKRIAESMCYAYHQQRDVDVRIARIFNTFGPRMHPNDGRVVSNFIVQALQNRTLTIYGDGKQTRSFQYVEDLVDGLIALMNSDYGSPVNIGNPEEFTIEEFATYIRDSISPSTQIKHLPAAVDDPKKRQPDITVAETELGWSPKWKVTDGLEKTIEYFRQELENRFENEDLRNQYQTHYVSDVDKDENSHTNKNKNTSAKQKESTGGLYEKNLQNMDADIDINSDTNTYERRDQSRNRQ